MKKPQKKKTTETTENIFSLFQLKKTTQKTKKSLILSQTGRGKKHNERKGKTNRTTRLHKINTGSYLISKCKVKNAKPKKLNKQKKLKYLVKISANLWLSFSQ